MSLEQFPQHESLAGEVDPATLEAEHHTFHEITLGLERSIRVSKFLDWLREANEINGKFLGTVNAVLTDSHLASYYKGDQSPLARWVK